jgi:hydrogenase maturation factor
MKVGKLPPEMLERLVLEKRGKLSRKVLVGPKLGVDVGVVKTDGKYMVSSTDPITGALERVGWLAVNISANDVATSGARPKYLLSTILLPEGMEEGELKRIMDDMDRAARSLEISILGGHTEITIGLNRVIIIATVIGFTDRFVTADMAREGDVIIMTKSAGIEGTAVLASSYPKVLRSLGFQNIEEAKEFFSEISVVKEAIKAFRSNVVNAMHDPTEGGIVGGVKEMAIASRLGFRIYESEIPVHPITMKLCDILHIDPLKLLSSGSLLISVAPRNVDKVIRLLKRGGVRARKIGKFTGNRMELIRKDGSIEDLSGPVYDEIWKVEELLS